MPVSNVIPKITYTGNGLTQTFGYPFRVMMESDMQVFVNGVQQINNYTVTGLNVSTGGSVVFSTAPALGSVVMLKRSVPVTRETDYLEGGDLGALTLDADFDRIVMQVQDLENSTIKQDGDGKYNIAGNVLKGVDRIEYMDGRVDEGGFIPVSWEFLSTGATSYQLPIASVGNANLYIVTDNGLVLPPLTYAVSVSEQKLSFLSDAPAIGHKIAVRLFGRVPESYENSINFNNIKRSFVFNSLANQTTFVTTTDNDLVDTSTDVYINGSKVLYELDYALSGKSVIFTVALSAGDVVEIVANNAIIAVNTGTTVSSGGTGIGDSWNWITKTTNYTASAFDAIFANTTGAGLTITLPPFPVLGDRVKIIDVAGNFSIGNLLIARNGYNIMSLAEDMEVTTNNKSIELVYSGPTYGWRVV